MPRPACGPLFRAVFLRRHTQPNRLQPGTWFDCTTGHASFSLRTETRLASRVPFRTRLDRGAARFLFPNRFVTLRTAEIEHSHMDAIAEFLQANLAAIFEPYCVAIVVVPGADLSERHFFGGPDSQFPPQLRWDVAHCKARARGNADCHGRRRAKGALDRFPKTGGAVLWRCQANRSG